MVTRLEVFRTRRALGVWWGSYGIAAAWSRERPVFKSGWNRWGGVASATLGWVKVALFWNQAVRPGTLWYCGVCGALYTAALEDVERVAAATPTGYKRPVVCEHPDRLPWDPRRVHVIGYIDGTGPAAPNPLEPEGA